VTPPSVTVLLATYAGERYLPAQLESLAQQRGVDWRLLWRDDGSLDGSVAAVEAFAATQPPGRVVRIARPAERLGAARGFLALLAAAPEDAAMLYAFCDQDDVWLPDKLSRAAAALAAVPADVPALACARQRLVGPGLEPLGLSPPLCRPPGFRNALVQNIATGCTVVLNAAARRVVLSAPPPPLGSMHDWWCYLTVSGAGGRVLFDPEPAVLYRQHGANTIGASASATVRAWRALRDGMDMLLACLRAHCDALEAWDGLSAEARETLRRLAPLRGDDAGPLARLRALRAAGLYRQGWLEDLAMWGWILARG
jgi:glycosyltransferase involved in cell wall biosynthesis